MNSKANMQTDTKRFESARAELEELADSQDKYEVCFMQVEYALWEAHNGYKRAIDCCRELLQEEEKREEARRAEIGQLEKELANERAKVIDANSRALRAEHAYAQLQEKVANNVPSTTFTTWNKEELRVLLQIVDNQLAKLDK